MPWLLSHAEREQKKTAQKAFQIQLVDQYIQISEKLHLNDTDRVRTLQNAYELLSILLIQNELDIQLWLKRAHIQQLQNNSSAALSDAHHALKLQPENSAALVLFVKLSLQVHTGDTFSSPLEP